MTTQSVQVKLELGHRASFRKKPTPEGFTHDWTVFVRGPEGSNIQHFVEKVVFYLHDSFPKPKRTSKEPPYSVTESGYAGFMLSIDIYFKNKEDPKKLCFKYDLFLNGEGSPPVNHIRCEKLTFQNPTEEFRRRLIKAGGIGILGPNEHSATAKATSSPSPPTPVPATTPQTAEAKTFQDLFGTPIQADQAKKPKSHHSSKEKHSSKHKSSSAGGASTNTASNNSTLSNGHGSTPTSGKPTETSKEQRDKSMSSHKDKDKSSKEKDKDKKKSSSSLKRQPDTSPGSDSSKKKRKGSASDGKTKERDEEKKDKEKEKERDRDKEKGSSKHRSKSHGHKEKDGSKSSSHKHRKDGDSTKSKEHKHKKSPHESSEKLSPSEPKDPPGQKDQEKEKTKHSKSHVEKKVAEKGKVDSPLNPPKSKLPEVKEKQASELPPFEDELSTGEVSDFDPFNDTDEDDCDTLPAEGSREPSASPPTIKPFESADPNELNSLLAEMSENIDEEIQILSPLPHFSPPGILGHSSFSPSSAAEKGNYKTESNTAIDDSKEFSSHSGKSKSRKKDRSLVEDKSKNGTTDSPSLDRRYYNGREEKENASAVRENGGMDIDNKPEKDDSEVVEIISEDMESEEPMENLVTPVAPNGESFNLLIDLQKRIMSMQDRELLQRVVDVIEESGKYKIGDATFDFDLCSLDSNTVHKLVTCLQVVS